MRSADGRSPSLRQAEMQYLSFGDQVLDRTGHVLDRHVRIDAMLIEQVDVIGPQAQKRCVGGRANVVWPTVQTRLRGGPVLAMADPIDSTVNLHLLLEEGAVRADARVQVARGVTNRHDVKDMLRFEKRNQGGDLNDYSIQYMMKIINAVQAKSHMFFDRSGRVNKSALRLVSNAIFTGSLEEDKGFRWLDVIKYWDLPEGTYFTVDALPHIAE